jgi:hypothetical protein
MQGKKPKDPTIALIFYWIKRKSMTDRSTKLGDHPLVVILSILGSLIAIYVFITGQQTFSQFLASFNATETPTPTATPLIEILGPEGGIFWESYAYDPSTGQLAYWGKTRGELNGLTSTYIFLSAEFDPTTGKIVPTPIYPSNFTNVVYMSVDGFDNGEYCFFLYADQAQLLIDKVEIDSVGFYAPANADTILTEDRFVRKYMTSGQHEVRINLYKSISDNTFVVLWGKPKNSSCLYLRPGIWLQPLP